MRLTDSFGFTCYRITTTWKEVDESFKYKIFNSHQRESDYNSLTDFMITRFGAWLRYILINFNLISDRST